MTKPNYDTIRGLEQHYSGSFKKVGIAAFIGLALTLFGSGTILQVAGIIILAISIIISVVLMVWMIRLQKEPVRHLYCPYCASKNDLFCSRKEFACDICNRRVIISPTGEPIPAEPEGDEDED